MPFKKTLKETAVTAAFSFLASSIMSFFSKSNEQRQDVSQVIVGNKNVEVLTGGLPSSEQFYFITILITVIGVLVLLIFYLWKKIKNVRKTKEPIPLEGIEVRSKS